MPGAASAHPAATAREAQADGRPLPLLRHELLDTLHGFNRGVGVAEGGQAHVALARGAEARARRGDDVCFGEQLVEKLPAPTPSGVLHQM